MQTPIFNEHKRAAVETIRKEHRTLAQVLELLRDVMKQIEAGHTEPDFHLLSLALYYIDDFPCRVHHPKEDEYLFAAVRRHTHDFDRVLAELDAEHEKDAHAVLELHRLFVLFRADAPGALASFRARLEDYAQSLYDHMRKEEAFLDDPGLTLPADEWREIAEAFAAKADPLLGPKRRGEFDVLHHRIVNLLPSKMRRAAVRPEW